MATMERPAAVTTDRAAMGNTVGANPSMVNSVGANPSMASSVDTNPSMAKSFGSNSEFAGLVSGSHFGVIWYGSWW